MIIQHNMAAMNTNRQLGISQSALSKSTEKLSSGYRINRAGDDAAGLAISEKMRSQIRGLDRASANSQDGISLIQTAEGALNESQNILQRMRELAVQAANGTNTDSDREEIQKEINQLTSEVNRIANTTEFNTMKLLKGNSDKSEIGNITTETLKEGAAGTSKGDLTGFKVETKSTQGKESTAILRGSKAEATGSFSSDILDTTKTGEAGAFSRTTVGGVEFKSKDKSDDLNGTEITIVSMDKTYVDAGATKNSAEGILYDNTNKKVFIALKQDTIDKFDKMADLMAYISNLTGGTESDIQNSIKAADSSLSTAVTSANLSDLATIKIEVKSGLPEGVSTDNEVKLYMPQQAGTTISNTMSNGKNEVLGEYTLDIEEFFKEDGDTVSIAGQTFTAKLKEQTNVNSANGEFALLAAGGTALNSGAMATSLAIAMSGNASIKEKFDVTVNNKTIKLTEKATFGGTVENGEVSKKISVQGNGKDSSIKITIPEGVNEELNFIFKDGAGTDASATCTNGKVEITLAKDHNGNTAAKIQKALRALGTQPITITRDDGTTVKDAKINFKNVTVESFGDWDKDTIGIANLLSKKEAGAGGGVYEELGEYSFDVAGIFNDGDTITVAGKTFTAKEKGADVYKGEFGVGTDKSSQASLIASALGQDLDIASKYTIQASNGKVTLKEKAASGSDLKAKDIAAQAVGTQGQFKLDKIDVLQDGASITIDGQKIEASSKDGHVGYANGTAIKVADSVDNQNAALADAINKNAELSKKYKASVEDGNLILTQKIGSDERPEITTTSSDKGTFDVTFQVGANTGQSMTIAIGDNRAASLGISGDGSSDSIMADNGATAYYTKAANVTDGTSNDNIEYALDITSYEKATAAIGVIDDALSAISAQRSQLGAYQNRLEHTIANLDNTSENLQSAESRIRDVDMAKEMTNFSKNNILQQAAQSMLAQANQSTQGVLTLLR